MNEIELAALQKLAYVCRTGLMSLTTAKGLTFHGFPSDSCGVAADIEGRLLWEILRYEGDYICARHHPKLGRDVNRLLLADFGRSRAAIARNHKGRRRSL